MFEKVHLEKACGRNFEGLTPLFNIFTVLYAALGFVLAAGIFYKVYLGSVLPSILLASLILFFRFRFEKKMFLSMGMRYAFLTMSMWFLIALFSSGINSKNDFQVVVSFFSVYFSGYLIFLSVFAYQFSYRQVLMIADFVLFGSLIPMMVGLYAAISYLGFPFTFLELVAFRFSMDASEIYRVMVMGNLTSMAAYLVIVFSIFIVRVRLQEVSRLKICFFYIPWIFLATFNSLLILSRTQIVVTILTYLASLIFFRKFKSLAFVFSLVVFCLFWVFLDARFEFASKYLFDAITLSSEDNSVGERIESIHYGIDIIEENMFWGVGTGGTGDLNPLSAAHQFNIQIASEIGVAGSLIVTLFMIFIFFKYGALLIFGNRNESLLKLFLVSSPVFSYFLYALVANAPKASNTVNGWIGLVLFFIPIVFSISREKYGETNFTKY